jgi:hypothetical protein
LTSVAPGAKVQNPKNHDVSRLMTRSSLMLKPWLTTRPWPRAATWLGVGVLCLGLASSACAPRASSVPLGLGPLALAERDAQAEAEANRRKSKLEPTRRPAVAAAAAKEPLVTAEAPKADASAETAASDKASSAEAAPAAAPARFEGMYAGDDIAVYRLTGSPELEQRDDKAKIRIERASEGNVSITLINSADGSDLCELVARVDGNAALIESAQPCFSGGEGSPEVELTSGRAVLEGDRLRMNAEGTLSMPDQELDGEMTYTFDGERQ